MYTTALVKKKVPKKLLFHISLWNLSEIKRHSNASIYFTIELTISFR